MKRRQRRIRRFESLVRSSGAATRHGPKKSRWLPLHPLAPGAAWGPDLAILWSAKGDVYQVVVRGGAGGAPRVDGRRAPDHRRGEVHGLFEVRTGTHVLGAEVVAGVLHALLEESIVARPGRRARLSQRARRWPLATLVPDPRFEAVRRTG